MYVHPRAPYNCYILDCPPLAGLGRSWSVEIPEIEKVAWTWCLFLAFTVPEVGTFIRSARLCFFKVSATGKCSTQDDVGEHKRCIPINAYINTKIGAIRRQLVRTMAHSL